MFLLEQVSHLFVKYATLFMWQLQNCVMFLEASGVKDLSMDQNVFADFFRLVTNCKCV